MHPKWWLVFRIFAVVAINLVAFVMIGLMWHPRSPFRPMHEAFGIVGKSLLHYATGSFVLYWIYNVLVVFAGWATSRREQLPEAKWMACLKWFGRHMFDALFTNIWFFLASCLLVLLLLEIDGPVNSLRTKGPVKRTVG